MMFCMRDLWHNFEYENEQVTNKEKSHSYIHHFPGQQKEIQILFMNVKWSITIKNIFWNLYKFQDSKNRFKELLIKLNISN